MTRDELVEHLARLHHEQLQVSLRLVNWPAQLVSGVSWYSLPEAERTGWRRAMVSLLDELDRLDLLAP